jgi:hypothetical protein
MERKRTTCGTGPARVLCTAALLLALAGTEASAQQYVFSLPNVTAQAGGVELVPMTLDNSLGSMVDGLATGICIDPTVVTPISVSQGTALTALNGGTGPDFWAEDVFPDGVTLAAVASFFGANGLLPAPAHEIAVIELEAIAPVGSQTALDFCSSLGSPPVSTVLTVSGASVLPATVDGSLLVGLPPPATFEIAAPGSAVPGASLAAMVRIDNTDPVSAFRFGITYPATQLDLQSIAPAAALAAVHGGTGPDILDIDLFPAGGVGATVECTISTAPPFSTIAPGLDQPLLALDFDVDAGAGPPCAVATIEFSAALGTPPVPIEVTVAGGPQAVPGDEAEVTIAAPPPAPPTGGFTLSAPTVLGVAGDDVTIPVRLDNEDPVQAMSFGIAYPSADLALVSATEGAQLAALQCGTGPEFFAAQILGGGSPGVTVAAVFDLQPPFSDRELEPGSLQEVAVLIFVTNPTPVAGGGALQFTDTLGSVPVAIELTVAGQAVTPATVDGAILFDSDFVRGDCNDDAMINIADPIFLLGVLFPGPGGPLVAPCIDACEGNDDGLLNIADVIALLGGIFSGGVIPAPSTCGADPTPDPLACAGFASCP